MSIFTSTTDLANRSCFINLKKHDDGYRFQPYPEGNLIQHITANRAKYLGAVYAVVKEWVRCGCQVSADPHHDFREWSSAFDWIVQHILNLHPLMEGHTALQFKSTIPDFAVIEDIYADLSAAKQLNKSLTAGEILEYSDSAVPDHLNYREERQYASYIGRILSQAFSAHGSKTILDMGSFKIEKSCKRITYSSGYSAPGAQYSFISC